MTVIPAIAIQTLRASIRSRVFHVLFGMILLAVFVLPLTVAGDGTAVGLLQVSLTYSLGAVTLLISTATLWLSCAALAREIEGYQLHLVTTKPAARWQIWLGKWAGVFLMMAFLFLVAALIVYSLIQWKIRRGGFSDEEMDRLRNEVLIGRRAFVPEGLNFPQMAKKEYEKRFREGTLEEGHSRDAVLSEILRQIKARSTELPHGFVRAWRFLDVKLPEAGVPAFLRYRFYVNSTSLSEQRMTDGMWNLVDPSAAEAGTYAGWEQREMSGVFHEKRLPDFSRFIDKDGAVVLMYTNGDPEGKSIMFQAADSPQLLVAVTGFFSNYMRAVFLVLLQLAFLAALGCTVGALLSTPVAVFVAISFLAIGLTVQAAVSAPIQNEFGEFEYRNTVERVAHYFALAVRTVVVSVDDFDASTDLARGRLIEGIRLVAGLFGLILLRSVPLAAVGVRLFTKRELGTVIRR